MVFFVPLKKYRLKFSIALLCVVSANLLALVPPWFLKVLLDGISHRNDMLLTRILCLLTAVVTLKAFLEYAGSYLGLEIAERFVADLRESIYRHLLSYSVLDIEDFSTGELISRVMADTECIKRFLFCGVLDFFYCALSAVFVIAVLFSMDVALAVMAALVLSLFLIVYGGMGKKLRIGYGLLRQRQAELSGRIGEVFRGIRTVHLLGQREYEVENFRDKQEQTLLTALGNHSGDARFFITAEFLSAVGLIALLGYGMREVVRGKMTMGTLVAFYTYAGLLFLPLLKMTASGGVYREARASWERIQGVFRRDAPASQPIPSPRVLKTIHGHVQFQNVIFTYGDSRRALSGVDLQLRPGEWTVLVGPSGCGKTTLTYILARLFEPASGRVLVDGIDIRKFSLEHYRRSVAIVGPNDFLFSDTIANNIRYGCLEAGDESIMASAKSAGIHSFISGLPRGYNTRIGEGGVQLSNGQRQRIVLARTLLRDPRILVLDEALSAVDPANFQETMRTIRWLRKDRSTLVITHRVPATEYADKIVKMNEGKIEDVLQTHVV